MSYRRQSIKKNRKGLNTKRYEDYYLQEMANGYFGDELFWDHYMWSDKYFSYSYLDYYNPRSMEEYYTCKFTVTLQKFEVDGAKQYHYDRGW